MPVKEKQNQYNKVLRKKEESLQAVGQWVDDVAEAATDEEDLLAFCLEDL